MSQILLGLFFLLFPALVIIACGRFSAVDKIGAGIICYGAGIVMSVAGLIPGGSKPLQEALMSVTVPLRFRSCCFPWTLGDGPALPGKPSSPSRAWSCRCSSWRRRHTPSSGIESREPGKLRACQSASIPVGSQSECHRPRPESPGTHHCPGKHFRHDRVHPLVFFILSFAQRTLGLFLPPFRKNDVAGSGDVPGAQIEIDEETDINDYRGIFSRAVLVPLMKAFGLSLAIFAGRGRGVLDNPQGLQHGGPDADDHDPGTGGVIYGSGAFNQKNVSPGAVYDPGFLPRRGSLADIRQLVTAALLYCCSWDWWCTAPGSCTWFSAVFSASTPTPPYNFGGRNFQPALCAGSRFIA